MFLFVKYLKVAVYCEVIEFPRYSKTRIVNPLKTLMFFLGVAVIAAVKSLILLEGCIVAIVINLCV